MIKVSILTMSDKGSRGEREDASGKAIRDLLDPLTYEIVSYEVIPDEFELIRTKLLSCSELSDLILTTGGTGLSPRDVTPDATLAVIEKQIPGIPEAMRAAGMQYTNTAMLSRAVAGTLRQCLIINLPGSPKAVEENLSVVLDAVPHAVEKLKGSKKECAR